MRTIFKYSLGRPQHDVKILELPRSATVVSVGMQESTVCIWCIVDTNKLAYTVQRKFMVVGTGWDIPFDDFSYHGRATEGVFEWHVIELV